MPIAVTAVARRIGNFSLRRKPTSVTNAIPDRYARRRVVGGSVVFLHSSRRIAAIGRGARNISQRGI